MPDPEVCSACGEEVRWGYRGGRLAWWHRDDVPGETTLDKRQGHEPVFGKPSWESNIRPVVAESQDENGEEDDRVFDIPAPEVLAHPIDVGDELMPGGAKILINAVRKAGGRAVASHSRGPRVHSSQGHLLAMSDYVVVKFERQGRRAVARWVRKKKWELDTGYILHYGQDLIYPQHASSDDIRAWLLKWQGPLREDETS